MQTYCDQFCLNPYAFIGGGYFLATASRARQDNASLMSGRENKKGVYRLKKILYIKTGRQSNIDALNQFYVKRPYKHCTTYIACNNNL